MPILTGTGEIAGNKAILTHALYEGQVAFRRGRWKWIPGINALYDMENDISETYNKTEQDWGKVLAEKMDLDLKMWLERLEKREARTENGSLGIC